jgi:3-oxoacyl-[acyl-carrier protein] reductase
MALKRVTEPQDIANAVLFLASEDARNITGQELAVDGGWDV